MKLPPQHTSDNSMFFQKQSLYYQQHRPVFHKNSETLVSSKNDIQIWCSKFQRSQDFLEEHTSDVLRITSIWSTVLDAFLTPDLFKRNIVNRRKIPWTICFRKCRNCSKIVDVFLNSGILKKKYCKVEVRSVIAIHALDILHYLTGCTP